MSTPSITQVTDELVSCCKLHNHEKSNVGSTPPEDTKYVRFPPKLIDFAKLLPGNDHCPDCKLRLAPVISNSLTWANIAVGTMICEECAFTHINVLQDNSSVVALNSDSWTLHQILSILEGGNSEMLKTIGKTRRVSLTGRTEPLTFENRYKSKDAMNYQRKLSKKALDACRTFKGVGVRKQQLEIKAELRAMAPTDFDRPLRNQLANVNFQEAKTRGRLISCDPSAFEEKINFEQLPSKSNFRQMYREQGESKGNASQRLLQVMKKNVPMVALPTDTRRRHPQSKKEKSRTRVSSEKAPQVDDDSVSIFFERINNMERDELQLKLDKQPTRQRGISPPPPRRKSFKSIDEKVKRPKSQPKSQPKSRVQLRGEFERGDAVAVPRRSQMHRGEERNKDSVNWRESVRQRFGVPSTDGPRGNLIGQNDDRQIAVRRLRGSNLVQSAEHKGTKNDMRRNGLKHGTQPSAQRAVQDVRPNVQKQMPTRSIGDKHNSVRLTRAPVANTFGNGSTRQDSDPTSTKHISSERQSGVMQSTRNAPPAQTRHSNTLRPERHPSTREKSGEEKHGKRGGREESRQITPGMKFDPLFDPNRHTKEQRKSENRASVSQGKRSDVIDMIGANETNQVKQTMDKRENAKVAVVQDLYPEPRPNTAKPDSRRREDVSKRSLTDSEKSSMMTQRGHHSHRELSRQEIYHSKKNEAPKRNVVNVEKNDNPKLLPEPSRQKSGRCRAPSEKENKFDMTSMDDNVSTNRRVSMDTAMQTVNTADAVVRTLANSVKPYDPPAPNLSTQIVLEFPADMAANFRQSVIHKRVSMDTCKAIVTEDLELFDVPVPGEPIFKNVQSKNVVRPPPGHDRRCSADTIPMSNRSGNGNVNGGGGSSTKGSKDASSSKNSSQQSGSSANTNGRNIDHQYRAYLEQQGTPNRGARVVNVSKRRTLIRNPVQGKKVVPSNIEYQSGPYSVQP